MILKPSKKTPAEVVLDIGSALGFVCRLALDYDLKRETLTELLEASYDAAVEIRSKSPGKSPEKSPGKSPEKSPGKSLGKSPEKSPGLKKAAKRGRAS